MLFPYPDIVKMLKWWGNGWNNKSSRSMVPNLELYVEAGWRCMKIAFLMTKNKRLRLKQKTKFVEFVCTKRGLCKSKIGNLLKKMKVPRSSNWLIIPLSVVTITSNKDSFFLNLIYSNSNIQIKKESYWMKLFVSAFSFKWAWFQIIILVFDYDERN